MIVLGIDVGASGIKGAPVDPDTGLLAAERVRIDTPASGTPEDVAAVVADVVRHFDWRGPFGCCLPMMVKQGIVASQGNMDARWIGLDAARLLQGATGQPVAVLNDADAAGLAEMRCGVGRGEQGVVMLLTFGTGLGSAVFVGGELVPNTAFGELVVRGKTLGQLVSKDARRAQHLAWSRWAERVNRAVARIEQLFPPDLFVLGGGASETPHEFLDFLHAEARLLPASLRNEAGIVGAALAARKLAQQAEAQADERGGDAHDGHARPAHGAGRGDGARATRAAPRGGAERGDGARAERTTAKKAGQRAAKR